MKTNIISAVTPAILALAAIALSFRYVNASVLIGSYLSVAGVGIVLALDYRLNWRRMIGR
jgi:hypothetical protein